MKKYLRSLFKISMLLITTGAMAMIVGLLLGGAGELSREVTELVHVVRKGVSETVERIPLLESLTNVSGFTLVVDKDEVTVEMNEQYETMSGDYVDSEVADISEVQNLDVSILNGTCRIIPSGNGYYGVSSTHAGEYQCYAENGTLYLNAFPGEFGKTQEDAEIVLYVPESAVTEKVYIFCSGEGLKVETLLTGKELHLSSIRGENVLNGPFVFDSAVLTIGVGTFEMSGLTAEEVKLEVSTADATIKELQARGLSVNLGIGSLSVEGNIEGNITLNCGMGHLDMSLAQMQNFYNYDISGSAESVQIGTDTLAGMVMERWIDNGSEYRITMSCAMGSVSIEFAEQTD